MSEPTVETSTEIIVPEIKAFSPDVFDPKKEQLQIIADEVAKIEADPSKMDKDTLTIVNATKNKLVKARTMIEKTGKALRDPHTAYNKSVSAYENELIAIIEPQEKRLKDIEADAKKIAIREERRLTLPEYKAKLAAIGDGDTPDKWLMAEFDKELPSTEEEYDEYLLTLDPNQRDVYYNARLGAHLQAQKAAADAKAEAEAREAEDKKAAILSTRREIMLEIGFITIADGLFFSEEVKFHNYEIAAFSEVEFAQNINAWRKFAEDREAAAEAQKQADIKAAEVAAETKAKEEAQKEADAKEAKRLADEADAKKAKEEAEAKEAAERTERESAEKFQQFLEDNSYNNETDSLVEDQDATGKVTILYREVSRYTHGS